MLHHEPMIPVSIIDGAVPKAKFSVFYEFFLSAENILVKGFVKNGGVKTEVCGLSWEQGVMDFH